MARSEVTEKLSLGDALKDLGWFSIVFAVVVGGPSLLAILQHVFVDHRLVEGFQWIVDGYNGLMALLGAAIEPLLRPAIDRLNSWLS